jgi:hypothetical protein
VEISLFNKIKYMQASYSKSFQIGQKSPHLNKLLNAFKSRRGIGWGCLTLAFFLQLGAVVWIAQDLKSVGDRSEALSNYILNNLSPLTLGSPQCSLDFAFQSPAQPPLVRKSEYGPILLKVILLASSTIFCVAGMYFLSKNPFKP